LPSFIVSLSSVLNFNANIDSHWINQEVYYNYKCDIARMGNSSMSSN